MVGCLGLISLGGCVAPPGFTPDTPEVGTWYLFERQGSCALCSMAEERWLYIGVSERWGTDWHTFKVDGEGGFDFGYEEHLRPVTGARPYVCCTESGAS